jgi:hypothetical protein
VGAGVVPARESFLLILCRAGDESPVPVGENGFVSAMEELLSMTTIMPESQALKNAVKWISSELQEPSHVALNDLIQQAIMRYDLSPLEGEFLARFYHSGEAKDLSAG